MENNDLQRLATMLVQRHGAAAAMFARMKAHEAMQNGNVRSSTAWNDVAQAVAQFELQKALILGRQ